MSRFLFPAFCSSDVPFFVLHRELRKKILTAEIAEVAEKD